MHRTLSPRTIAAAIILLGWTLGIVAFARREMSRSTADRMVEIALRVAPGATYFAAERGGRHVGFASTTVDTLARTLQVTEYRVIDGEQPGAPRLTTQLVTRLSRGLALREFTLTSTGDSAPRRIAGWMADDSTLAYSVIAPGVARDTQRVRVPPGVVLESMVPLTVALGSDLKIGESHAVDAFDPATGVLRTVRTRIVAESTFMIADSAVYDASRSKWTQARMDTVVGWQMTVEGSSEPAVWIDELGHAIAWQGAADLNMRRTAYELAFENWRTLRPRATSESTVRGNIAALSAIRAGRQVATDHRDAFRVRLTGIPLNAFDLAGFGQLVSGDTLTVQGPSTRALVPSFVLPPDERVRQRFASSLGSAPLLEVDAPAIINKAQRLNRKEQDPSRAVERILMWMRDSIERAPTDGSPGALRTMRERRGDADAHAMLFVALARASGIPARTAVGLLAIDGRFYPHAWAEVFLQSWIAVDPVLNQFPATPTHVRFLVDGVGALDDFIRATERLRVDTLAFRP